MKSNENPDSNGIKDNSLASSSKETDNFDKTDNQFNINEESNQPTDKDQSEGVEELLEEDNNNSQSDDSDKEVSTPYVI